MRRIGVLIGRSETDPEGQEWSAALERGLKELGWIPGRTALIDYRWQTSDRRARYWGEMGRTADGDCTGRAVDHSNFRSRYVSVTNIPALYRVKSSAAENRAHRIGRSQRERNRNCHRRSRAQAVQRLALSAGHACSVPPRVSGRRRRQTSPAGDLYNSSVREKRWAHRLWH